MAVSVQFVTRSRRVAQMPQWASEFAELVQHCGDSGLFTGIARRLRFWYKRSFGVLDLTVFFMALACGYNKAGIRGFRDGIQACAVRLAATGGTRLDLRAELRVNNERLGLVLTDLETRGAIARTAHGWTLVAPAAGRPPQQVLALELA